MKIYTKTGDYGTTRTLIDTRISKSDIQIHCLGEMDELSSHLSLVVEHLKLHPGLVHEMSMVVSILHWLFDISTHVASLSPNDEDDEEEIYDKYRVNPPVNELEQWIDDHDGRLPKLTNFILSIGSIEASHVHVARSVCRRVERSLVALYHHLKHSSILEKILPYFNRLSDLLFVLARTVNHHLHKPEIIHRMAQPPSSPKES